ncbi:hypothetical protein DKP76_06810 [Falsochrobactrum shanghaiense]|uniref:SnoaL-like domain-containing protein n=1 Tax=Falsochrobactrum shanghaiense TaxID=2201899 RepID=A0A316JUC2_9HYPH|nr:hypothetical protein [Falsochrobactrum shanghaiense]PWL18770.1 hypothetical protein DKP76_06810 [Falsochrobactrum shanghaiense]
MKEIVNPFKGDKDREQIWDMLVRRDIEAFVAQDWARVADDFDEERFLGIHAHGERDPDKWDAAFATLSAYRAEWLRQAAQSAATQYAESLAQGIYRATNLSAIDITENVAVARKKFDGTIAKADGSFDRLNWQTLYFCRSEGGRWRITGFVGYMAYR